MPVASLCSQAASNSIITLFRASDQRYHHLKKKKTAFLDSRILPKKSNSLNLFEGKKYGTFDQSGTPRPDTACLVHHWLSSFNFQSMDHYLLTAQEARENLLLLLRYTTPTVLLLYNNLSNDCVSSGRGLLH